MRERGRPCPRDPGARESTGLEGAAALGRYGACSADRAHRSRRGRDPRRGRVRPAHRGRGALAAQPRERPGDAPGRSGRRGSCPGATSETRSRPDPPLPRSRLTRRPLPLHRIPRAGGAARRSVPLSTGGQARVRTTACRHVRRGGKRVLRVGQRFDSLHPDHRVPGGDRAHRRDHRRRGHRCGVHRPGRPLDQPRGAARLRVGALPRGVASRCGRPARATER